MEELEKANRKKQQEYEREQLAREELACQQAAVDGDEEGVIGEGGMKNPYLERRRQNAGEDSDSDEGGVVKEDVDSDDEPVQNS